LQEKGANMTNKQLYKIAGLSYVGIFFLAIFANFFVLESIKNDPVEMVSSSMSLIGFGAMAFLGAAILDIVVAWVLRDLFKKHSMTTVSTYLRLAHAFIMGIAVFALIQTRGLTESDAILAQVSVFETIWLIGLFFFGAHLILLSKILYGVVPKWMGVALWLAGTMYMLDTTAQFTFADYDSYADTFLALVAIPSILGEMAFSIWLLVKANRG
jgi:hypothetical protein